MSDFAENLRRVIFEKRLKAADVARATKITPPTISRYLSGTHHPTTDNLIAISKYLEISPEALLSSSEAPESSESSRYISSDKDKIIEVLEELVGKYKQENEELRQRIKEWKASSKERHAKGKAKADRVIAKSKKRKPKK